MYYIRSKLKVEVDIRCANQSKRKEDCMLDIIVLMDIAKDDHYYGVCSGNTGANVRQEEFAERYVRWGKNNNEDFGLRRTYTG
jgi:hypothetical protein